MSYDAQMLGCTTASLEVEDGNEGAIALYASLGFTEAGPPAVVTTVLAKMPSS